MPKFLSWKIIVIILAGLLLGFFNLGSESQKNILPATPDSITSQKIRLGLDLQGGTQLDYKIDLRKVPEKDRGAIVEGVKEVINKRVNGLGVSEPNIYSSSIADEEHIIVELAGIKDIEEAKATVGKTIQLEFKEQRTEIDPNEKEKIQTQAETILQKLLTDETADFAIIGEEEKLAYAGKVDYTVAENFKFQDELTGSIAEKAFQEDVANGNIIPELIETTPADNEMGVNALRQVSPRTGYSIYKVMEKQEVERKIDHEKEVKASHILISYQGVEKPINESITRTEEEAKKRAEEALAKVKAGEDFAVLAKEYSDEPGAKETGGDLGFFPHKQMVKEFSDAVFAMTKDQISEPVKSPFGYHIIKVTDIKEASSETKVEPQVKLARLFYSTEPDPWKETELTGEHFVRADVQFDNFYNPYISIQFNEEGAKLFEEITGRNVQKPVAIFVGGQLISSPNVQEKISGGSAQISGKFTLEEATNLARDLNTGAIPAPISLSGQFTIGATLGQEALTKSLTAGAIGIIILALAMILYYRLPGVIAVVALFLYALILIFLIKVALPIWAAAIIAGILFFVILMKILQGTDSGWEKLIAFILDCFILFFVTFLLSSPVVLTLAGIAGIILSIGMAVDANILIFERVKEELGAGRTLSAAIETGFDRAWSSIRDSNFSSLITCGILFYFGTSIIQGFALNLAMGILVSMFTAITITKTLLRTVLSTSFGQNLKWYLVAKPESERSWNIIGKSKVWFGFSGILIAISLIAILSFGFKLGLDFTGGTLLEVQFENKAVTSENIQKVFGEKEFGTPVIIPTDQNTFIIRTKHLDNETQTQFTESLKTTLGNFEQIRFTTIGPTIGETLKKRALFALAIALFMIILYIAFAFRKIPKHISPWRFGVCALVALIHDVIISVGAFVIFGKVFNVEIDALFITALLTIIGFSVHDTIVVFDRIRENLRYQNKGDTLDTIANRAMNQTMARSINTSFATLLTITALAIFGTSSTRFFVIALIVGITIGTYSSIFTASPLLVAWKNWTSRTK